jgi:hypothetical protein
MAEQVTNLDISWEGRNLVINADGEETVIPGAQVRVRSLTPNSTRVEVVAAYEARNLVVGRDAEEDSEEPDPGGGS